MKKIVVVAVAVIASGLVDARASVPVAPLPVVVPLVRPAVPKVRASKKVRARDARPLLEEKLRADQMIRTQA